MIELMRRKAEGRLEDALKPYMEGLVTLSHPGCRLALRGSEWFHTNADTGDLERWHMVELVPPGTRPGPDSGGTKVVVIEMANREGETGDATT